MNVDGALIAIAAAAAAAVGLGLADITALVVAAGTLVAGVIHARRLRLDRPKVVQEITSSVQQRLEAENALAWRTVDSLREREEELERKVAKLERERGDLERKAQSLTLRVDELERRVDPGRGSH